MSVATQSRITNRDLFALTLRYAMQSDLAIERYAEKDLGEGRWITINGDKNEQGASVGGGQHVFIGGNDEPTERYAKYKGERTPSLFTDDDKPTWITVGAVDHHGGHPVQIEKKTGKMITGHFAGMTLSEAFGPVGKKHVEDHKKPDYDKRLADLKERRDPDGIESNEKLTLFDQASKVFEESAKKPPRVSQWADSDKASEWETSDEFQYVIDTTPRLKAMDKLAEKEDEDTIEKGDYPDFDEVPTGPLGKKLRQAVADEMVKRGMEVPDEAYKVFKMNKPSLKLMDKPELSSPEKPDNSPKTIPFRDRNKFAADMLKAGKSQEEIKSAMVSRGVAISDARMHSSKAMGDQAQSVGEFAGVEKEEADKAGKPKTPSPGIVMPSQTIPNDQAKAGDQLGLFGDATKAKVPAFKPKLLDQPKQANLFDTKGNPNQMDLFGDGVMPDELVYNPEAKKKDVDADSIAKMAPGANKRMESERKGREDNTRELESNRKWAENHITIAADDISKLRKSDVYRVLNDAPNDKRGYLENWIGKNRPDLHEEINEASQEIDEERANAKPAEPAKPAFKPKLIDQKKSDEVAGGDEPKAVIESPIATHSEKAFAAADIAKSKGETPRQVAKAAQDQLDKDYEFARASDVRNAGEDLKGSARHKVNAWKGLAAAEKDGTAEKLVNREGLQRLEPHDLMTHADKNPLTSLAMHYALRNFPPAPAGDTKTHTAEKNREQYLDAYRAIKDKANELAASTPDHATGAAVSQLRDFVSKKLREFRQQTDSASAFTAKDKYNPTANLLIKTYNALSSSTYKNKTGVVGRLEEFSKEASEKYGNALTSGNLKTTDDKKEFIDNLSRHAKDVIEGQSLNKTFGKEAEKRDVKRFDPSEAYVKIATRNGGRDLSKITADPVKAVDHMVKEMGMRGVQWGNSVTDDERKHHAAKALEAITDLADVTGLHPKDIALDGNLGLAIGARGKGTASAHYEPGNKVINLTRANGVGTLAHEWGHAFDHMLNGFGLETTNKGEKVVKKGGYMSNDTDTHELIRRYGKNKELEYRSTTSNPERHKEAGDEIKPRERSDIRDAYRGLNKASKGFRERLKNVLQDHVTSGLLNSKKASDYWNSDHEIFARSFEQYVMHKMKEQGIENTYLSGMSKGHAYWPTPEESKAMAPAFDKIFEQYRKEKHGSSDPIKYSARDVAAVFMPILLERYSTPAKPFIDDGDLLYDPVCEQYTAALSCLVERYDWVSSKHPRDAIGRFTKTRELAAHPDLQGHHSLHIGNQNTETQLRFKDTARGFRNLLANASRKSEFNGGDQSEESIWANVDKTALRALLDKTNQADHASMKSGGPKFHELVNANQVIPRMIAERLHGGSRFFDPTKLRGRWNEPEPTTEQAPAQQAPQAAPEAPPQAKIEPSQPPQAEAQPQPKEMAQPAPQPKPAKPKRAPITPEELPEGVSKTMSNRLGKSIKALIGDNPEAIKELKSISIQAWKQLTQEVSDHNQAFRQIAGGLEPMELMRLVDSARKKTLDYSRKKNFDIMADSAKRQYPHIIGTDAEEGLTRLLETGIKANPKLTDPEVAERAVSLAGPDFFRQFEQGEAPEYDEPQTADDWNDQFSWAVAKVMVERYRREVFPERYAGKDQMTFNWDEASHPREPKGAEGSKGGEFAKKKSDATGKPSGDSVQVKSGEGPLNKVGDGFHYIASGKKNARHTLRYKQMDFDTDGKSTRIRDNHSETLTSDFKTSVEKAKKLLAEWGEKTLYADEFELNDPDNPRDPDVFKFGKHEGKTISEVDDPGYIQWAWAQPWLWNGDKHKRFREELKKAGHGPIPETEKVYALKEKVLAAENEQAKADSASEQITMENYWHSLKFDNRESSFPKIKGKRNSNSFFKGFHWLGDEGRIYTRQDNSYPKRKIEEDLRKTLQKFIEISESRGAKEEEPDYFWYGVHHHATKALESLDDDKETEVGRLNKELRAATSAQSEKLSAMRKGAEAYGSDGESEMFVPVLLERYGCEPTEAQRRAGNYKMAHIRVHGMPISIETPKGKKRNPDWPTLAADYGYFKNTLGKDGDHIDVFVGPDKTSEMVFVIDQVGLNGKFDEHKVLIGFANQADAVATYRRCYYNGWKVGPVTAMTIAQFKNWIASGKHKRPIAKQVSRYSMFEPMLIERYWDEMEHPRGQPENKGEFVEKEHLDVLNGLADQIEYGSLSKTAAGKKLDELGLKHLRPNLNPLLRQRENKRKPVGESVFVPDEADAVNTSDETEETIDESTTDKADDEHQPSVIKSPREIAKAIESRNSDFQAKKGLIDIYRRSIGVRAASDLQNSIEAASQLQLAHSKLIDSGWNPESMTKSGSAYYTKNGRKLRVSDHEVPETDERKHNSSLGGFSWATDGEQLILPVDDLDHQIGAYQ